MQPIFLMIFLASAWALLHFWLTPRVKTDWDARDLRGKMTRAGILAVLEKLGDLAGIGALVIAIVVLVVALATLLGGSDVVWPKKLVEGVASFHDIVEAFAKGYGKALMWIGALGGILALWLAWRKAKQRVVEVWMAKASEEHDAILNDPSRLNDASEDPDLRPIVEQIEIVLQHLQLPEEDGGPDAAVKAQLQKQLTNLLVHLSIERSRKTVDFPAATDKPAVVEAEQRTGRWARFLTIVSTKKFGEDLGLARKPLNRVVTGLLFLSLIGWSAEPLANSFQLTVNNLRIQLSADAAQRELEETLSQSPVAQIESLPNPNVNVQTATRVLTRAIVREMTRAPILGDAAGIRRRTDDGAEVFRGLLAEQTPASVDSIDDVAAQMRREAALAASVPGSDAPTPTSQYVERQITPIVERLHRDQPGRLQHMVARVEARYSAAPAILDAQSRLTEKMLDYALSHVEAHPVDQIGIQGQKLAKDFGKKAVQTRCVP